jgi:hypothetical protein
MSQTTLGIFNTQLLHFFEELSDTFPEEKEIRMATEAISSAKKINPRLVLDLFYNHLYVDFHQFIANKDVEGMILQGRKKVLEQFNEIMPAITIFDKYWPSLSDSNRESIWKYLKVLCILCERASGMQQSNMN